MPLYTGLYSVYTEAVLFSLLPLWSMACYIQGITRWLKEMNSKEQVSKIFFSHENNFYLLTAANFLFII